MTKFSGFFIVLLSAGVILHCSASKQNKKPMTEGEQLFKAKCRSCHTLPNPEKFDDNGWVPVVTKYGERAKLNNEQIRLIIKYLQDNN
ncbi:MAG: hypothetical protein AB7W47_11530 [Calditrichaceae bacterium]